MGDNWQEQSIDGSESWDFFISYSGVDRPWAEWISWQLEAAGYRVLFQHWDFVPGINWTGRMQDGIIYSDHVLAILSLSYLRSVYGAAEWRAAIRDDPRGIKRKLIPVRIEDCPRPGLLGDVVSFDIYNLTKAEASSVLINNISNALVGRAKPSGEPSFPEPEFPPVTNQSRRSATQPGWTARFRRLRPVGFHIFGGRVSVRAWAAFGAVLLLGVSTVVSLTVYNASKGGFGDRDADGSAPQFPFTSSPSVEILSSTVTGSISDMAPHTNISASGSLDWAYWGYVRADADRSEVEAGDLLNRQCDPTHCLTRKETNGESWIENYEIIGDPIYQHRYYIADAPSFEWTGGREIQSATQAKSRIFVDALNQGFRIRVAADREMHTLKIYYNAFAGAAKIDARFDGSDASSYTDTSVSGDTPGKFVVCTMMYRANSDDQTLTVELTLFRNFGSAHVGLMAATLS